MAAAPARGRKSSLMRFREVVPRRALQAASAAEGCTVQVRALSASGRYGIKLQGVGSRRAWKHTQLVWEQLCPRVDLNCPEIGRVHRRWAEITPEVAGIAAIRPKNEPTLPEVCRIRSRVGRIRTELVGFAPEVAIVAQINPSRVEV